MALIKGVNSYASLGQAEAYCENRLDADAWFDATDDQQFRSLITATSILDTVEWPSTVVSSSQPLAFPRVGFYFDPRLGTVVTMRGPDAPDRILKATIELALHLLLNDGLLQDSGSVTDLKIGPIELTSIKAASRLPPVVTRLIAPLSLNGARGNTWFRAN